MYKHLLCIAVVAISSANTARADLVYGFVSEMINDNGLNTASVRLVATATGDTLTQAASLQPVGASSVNVLVELSGDVALANESVTIVSTSSIPGFGPVSFGPPATATVSHGGVAVFSVAGVNQPFAGLLAGDTVELWKLDLTTTGSFTQGLDDSQIKLTIIPGVPQQFSTSVGQFGNPDPPFSDPGSPYHLDISDVSTTLVVAVPEPSSSLFLGGLACVGGAAGWWKRRNETATA